MLHDPQGANGAYADVYSLAKTLWVLLTGRHGFRQDWSFDVVSATQRLLGELLTAPREKFEEAFRQFAATLRRPQGPLRR